MSRQSVWSPSPAPDGQLDAADIRSGLERGELPAWVFSDLTLYRAEMDRVFPASWCYLGHESEIPRPGDFVTRSLGDDSVIITRDTAGALHCLLNTCRHRGMQVCRVDRGNASRFTCPYHGWTYSSTGELTGVPAERAAYDGLDTSQWGLHPVAQLDTYRGLIFATWSADAPPLETYLGAMAWYLDLLFNRSEGGLEVIGPAQRWIVDANWKIAADNFIGDGYHILTTHGFAFAAGLSAARLPGAPVRDRPPIRHYHVYAGNGHGVQLVGGAPPSAQRTYLGLPQELWPQLEANLSQGQREAIEYATTVHGTVFPNLSLLNAVTPTPDGSPIGYITLRQWQPKGPDKMELWSWFLVERSAPEWYRQASYETYVLKFGAGGTFEQDDTEIWTRITQGAKGTRGRRNRLAYLMGLDGLEQDHSWPGPGEAYSVPFCELNQRRFFGRWLELLAGEETRAAGR
ncbi:MAG TPA: aromatic ring-hydroxylating dioxygenase subunit alpha [Chloroflexota bacterium]|nr:aromatic ring-hydroxylating dioxygenase subunit alpha [Chloroflexota bacterium]